ncbi:hypothetical protein FA13DRAFT_204098 [Coprinellus micaceus]|uniref:Uncharacterized protein n=1 Tax=Coprinellus micaceus TaxID=71717 RepID=A0A4Y7SG68_COPMI|nr:hypothetical protein FA13DRAFT_204098 [Coprinellus micaceus]
MVDERTVGDVSTQLPAPFADSTQSDLDSGRLHLSTAFRCLLIAIPFPAVSWLLWSGNLRGSYFQHDDRPRLCDFTPRYCDTLASFPSFVMPTTGAFAIIFLLYLDHFLVVSPTLRPPQAPSTAIQSESEVEHSTGDQASGDRLKKQQYRARVVLRLIVIAWICTALCTFCCIVAMTNATLVLRLDSPFEKARWDNKVIFRTRVVLGYGEALSEAVLAYYVGKTALALSRAKRAIGIGPVVVGEGWRTFWARLSRAGRRIVERCWQQRAVLDKAVVCLVSALALSFVSAIVCLEYEPPECPPLFTLLSCFLTIAFAWPTVLLLHGYSSSNISIGKTHRILISGFLLLLTPVYVLTSSVFIFEYVCALLCPWFPDLPSCSYVRYRSIWPALVMGLAGYAQAWSLGGAAALVWRAGRAVFLEPDTE